MERLYPLIRPRDDESLGLHVVVETSQAYVEPDGSDVRVKRVYVLGGDGNIEHTFIEDEVGARFKDNLDLEDREDWKTTLGKLGIRGQKNKAA